MRLKIDDVEYATGPKTPRSTLVGRIYAGYINEMGNLTLVPKDDDRDAIEITDRKQIDATYRDAVVYLCDNVENEDITRLMGPNDSLNASGPTSVTSFDMHTGGGGRVVFMLADAWMLDGTTPWTILSGIRLVLETLGREGIPFKRASAGVARHLIVEAYPGKLFSLPPRYRCVSYAATQAGPITHVRGHSPNGYHIDRRGAYLQALKEPLPGLQDWGITTRKGFITSRLARETQGFISCTMQVPHDGHTEQLAPLPVTSQHGTKIHPVGIVKGIWPVSTVRMAIELYGCELLDSEWMCSTTMRPWMNGLASRLEGMPKAVAKAIYTRIWGVAFSTGSYTGKLEPDTMNGVTNKHTIGRRGFYMQDNNRAWSDKFGPYHRPDVSAIITSYNHNAMLEAVHKLRHGSLIATHVDAIWADDWAARPSFEDDKWSTVGTGDIRFFAAGRYIVDGPMGVKIGQSGIRKPYEQTKYGAELFARACANEAAFNAQDAGGSQAFNNAGLRLGRVWSDRDGNEAIPSQTADTYSGPMVCTEGTKFRDPGNGRWTMPNERIAFTNMGHLSDAYKLMLTRTQ